MAELAGAVLVALIVGVVGPTVTVWLTGRHRAAERAEDRADRAAVAAQVVQVQETLHESDAATIGKLDEIHTLVNSNLSAALGGQLEALQAQAVLMRAAPSADGDVLAGVEAKIAALEVTMADRAVQTAIGQAQADALPDSA